MIKVLPAHIATEMLRKKRKDRIKAMLESELNFENNKNSNTNSKVKLAKAGERSVNFLSANNANLRNNTKSDTNLATSSSKSPNATNKMYKQNRHKSSGFHDLHIKSHSNVSILYADIVNFTPLADKFEPPELVNILNKLFSEFDQKADVKYISNLIRSVIINNKDE